MDHVISIKKLNYSYPDGNLALEDISLDISAGELIALLGPNGAGKSTLLLHLNGILKGDGLVEVFDRNIRDKHRSELITEVGIVFQDPDDQLFMPTVFDDVAFGPLNMGLSRSEIVERVESSLEKVGLRGYGNRYPHNLSLGEKKKASIATILAMEPEVIVLDEPTSNLDPKSRRDILEIIKNLKEKGKTIIIATHDVDFVPEIADRIYILNRKVVAEGNPRDIFMNPELLEKANLDTPAVTRLFEILTCFGYNCENLPLSMDEAISHLTETIDSGGGHLHLHIHEHTHKQIKKLKGKRDHHSGDF